MPPVFSGRGFFVLCKPKPGSAFQLTLFHRTGTGGENGLPQSKSALLRWKTRWKMWNIRRVPFPPQNKLYRYVKSSCKVVGTEKKPDQKPKGRVLKLHQFSGERQAPDWPFFWVYSAQ
ncbi:MAG TPA: hypothetical protein DD433_06815 [Ruminococcaceae bacterium]|nr:hypothetical protein [Oscillospiraceae bacterium]